MKRNCIVLATILCTLMLAWRGNAQDSSPSKNQPPQDEGPRERLLSLDFGGGTAADYVAAVRKVAPDANIVVMADVSSISMPPVQLKNVDVRSALRVLNSIPQDQPGRHIEVNVATDHAVHTISARFLTTSSVDRDSTVMDISGLLEGQTKPADVLTAIETALQMLQGEYQPAQIKFHEATGLLIARGHPEQIGTIQRVVQQLNEKNARLRRRAEEADNAKADASKVTELAGQLEQSRRQMDDFARQGAEWKTKFDVMQAELERARNELQARERAIADLQRQVNELTMERNQKKP